MSPPTPGFGKKRGRRLADFDLGERKSCSADGRREAHHQTSHE